VQPHAVDTLHKFAYPYPKIQQSSEFDYDYTKDDNGDNGHWKLQMNYDITRHKAGKAKEVADGLYKVMQDKEKALENATKSLIADESALNGTQKEFSDVQKVWKNANRKKAQAEEEVNHSKEYVDKFQGAGEDAANSTKGKCDADVAKAKKRVDELKKLLEDAKNGLSKTKEEKKHCIQREKKDKHYKAQKIAERHKADEATATSTMEEVAKEQKRKAEALKKADSKLHKIEKEVATLEEALKNDTELVNETEAEHTSAVKAYEEADQLAQKAEKQAKEAYVKLQGSTRTHDSGTSHFAQSMSTVVAVLVALMMF